MSDRARSFRLLRIPAATLQAMRDAASTGRSPEEAAVLMRQVGLASGGALHELLGGWLADVERGAPGPESLEVDEFWRKLSEYFSQLGWGSLSHERLHPGVVSIASSDWFEAEGAGGEQPCCHLTTGVLADLTRRLAGVDLSVMEVECRGAGAPACRFLVGAPAALEAVYEGMSRGDAFTDAIAALA